MYLKKVGFTLFSLLLAVQAQALNILLTNDDGYDHPWIRAVHTSLTEAGHQVTLVAPAANKSGQSAALTLTEVHVENPEPGIYAVHATPATAVTLGVRDIMSERPDLVVSGINDAANIGVLSSISGTVGATVAALHLLGNPIPAIAISGNPLEAESDPRSEKNVAHARNIADFLSRLVASLEDSREERGGLLPPGIALNINYPAVPPQDIKGVGVYRHGHDIREFLRLDNRDRKENKSADAPPQSPRDSDTVALEQGYITIVPIDGDYTAHHWQQVFPSEFFESLSPATTH